MSEMRLQGKVAVVTGAGAGMGRACALEFARQGALVVAADANAQSAFETSKMVIGGITPVKVDVGDENSVGMLARFVLEKYGPAQIVVSAMWVAAGGVGEMSNADWTRAMSVNVGGVFQMAKAFLPQLRETQGSIVAVTPSRGFWADAVEVLAKALAAEESVRNVRANCVRVGGSARTEEVAQAAVFLAGDEAGGTTGSSLNVNGGTPLK